MEDFSRSQMEFENLIGQDDPPIDIDEDNEDQQLASRHDQEQHLHEKIPILKKNPTSPTACRTEEISKKPNASSSEIWMKTVIITDMDIDPRTDHQYPINFTKQKRSMS